MASECVNRPYKELSIPSRTQRICLMNTSSEIDSGFLLDLAQSNMSSTAVSHGTYPLSDTSRKYRLPLLPLPLEDHRRQTADGLVSTLLVVDG